MQAESLKNVFSSYSKRSDSKESIFILPSTKIKNRSGRKLSNTYIRKRTNSIKNQIHNRNQSHSTVSFDQNQPISQRKVNPFSIPATMSRRLSSSIKPNYTTIDRRRIQKKKSVNTNDLNQSEAYVQSMKMLQSRVKSLEQELSENSQMYQEKIEQLESKIEQEGKMNSTDNYSQKKKIKTQQRQIIKDKAQFENKEFQLNLILKEMQEKNTSLNQKCQEQSQIIEQLTKDLNDIQFEANSNMNNLNSEFKDKELFWKNKIEKVLKELEEKAKSQQTFEVTYKKHHKQLKNQISKLKVSKSQIKKSCVKTMKEKKQIHKQFNEFQLKSKEVQQKQENLINEITASKDQLEKTISDLKHENVHMKTDVSQLFNMYEEELKDLKTDNEDKSQEMNKSQYLQKELEKKLHFQSHLNNNLQEKAKMIEAKASQLKSQNFLLKSQVQETTEQINEQMKSSQIFSPMFSPAQSMIINSYKKQEGESLRASKLQLQRQGIPVIQPQTIPIPRFTFESPSKIIPFSYPSNKVIEEEKQFLTSKIANLTADINQKEQDLGKLTSDPESQNISQDFLERQLNSMQNILDFKYKQKVILDERMQKLNNFDEFQ